MNITRPEIDIKRLKNEIKKLAKLNAYHKYECRKAHRVIGDLGFSGMRFDKEERRWKYPDPVKDKAYKTWCESGMEWHKLSSRITRLCTLRALSHGKIHFSANSSFPKDLSEEGLWKWVYPEAKEFSKLSM